MQKKIQSIPKNAKKVFEGEIFDVYQWKQKLYNGEIAIFEKLKRPDTVIIFPVLEDNRIIIAEQEQPGIKLFCGAPAGRVDKGESILNAAKRELLEETGYAATEFIKWFSYQPAGKIDWVVYFFIAKGCKKIAEQNLDGGEKIKLKFVSYDEFIEFAASGKFPDRELRIKILEAKMDKNKMEKLRKLFFG